MNDAIYITAAAAGPAIGLLLQHVWKRAGWVAGTVLTFAALGYLFLRPFYVVPFLLLALWGIAGTAYGAYLSWNARGIEPELDRKRSKTRLQRAELEAKLLKAKNEWADTRKEQKRALAVYTAIKSLSETLDISSISQRLSACITDCLDLDEFALYLQDMHDESARSPNLQLVVKRNFENSGLGDFGSLRSLMEKSGHDFSVPFVLNMKQSAFGVVPIFHVNEFIGCLAAAFPPSISSDTARQELLQAMHRFGEKIAFALKRVMLFQAVEWLSRVDGLTGVCRRNVLDERLKEETMRARTFKTTYCFLILDIDHFKKINDTYGHQFGDFVLNRIGEILKSSVYETDFVARYGGEEFAIILPRADPVGVLRKAEMIRLKMEEEDFAQGFETVRVTVSIGIAHYPRDGSTPEEVVSRADAALYAAKDQGRNRILDLKA